MRLRVLRFGFLQDRNVGVGVFPKSEEVLVGSRRKNVLLPDGPLITVQPVENVFPHKITRRNMPGLEYHMTLVS